MNLMVLVTRTPERGPWHAKLLTAMGAFSELFIKADFLLTGRLADEPARQARALLRQDTQDQGVFMMAKAKCQEAIAAASIDHLRRYIKLLIQPPMHNRRRRHDHEQYVSRCVPWQ